MKKFFSHNYILVNKSFDIKSPLRTNYTSTSANVDINKLLNRVKLEERSIKKNKIILLGVFTLVIAITAYLLSL